MNDEIKAFIDSQHLYKWQIAKVIGIHETAFSKWFREELTEEQKKRIFDAVEVIKKMNEDSGHDQN